MRTVKKSNLEKLKGTWRVEATILDLLTDRIYEVKLLTYYQALESLTGQSFDLSAVKRQMFTQLLNRSGRPILLSELILQAPERKLFGSFKIDPSLTQKFNSIIPSFAQNTEGMVFKFTNLQNKLLN